MLQQLISSRRLLKAQLLQFLGLPETSKQNKETLIPQILTLLETDAAEKERFLETFKSELAVEPVELEELLGCTQTERKRWIKEGKLPVLEYRSFRQSGTNLQYPVHDRRLVLSLSQADIQQWREEHQARIKQNRHTGSQAAAESRKENQRARQDFISAWDRIQTEWLQKSSPEISAALQLAYWTVWASRWAKENQLKRERAIKHADLYSQRNEEWYERKNQAVEFLSKTPWATLSFYRPEYPDKITLCLCDEHCEMMWDLSCFDKWEFFSYNKSAVINCPDCLYREEEDYYSLYYLQIKTDRVPEFSFSFHTPYPIGKQFWPSPKSLPKLEHVEEDGLFRFGRPLLEQEKIIHREKDVLANFERALAGAKGCLPVWGL